jgi:oxygen-dependent protoporphyrinogen oxidase
MIAIIGGGISGLSLAWYLEKKGMAYTIFEASDSVGGNIQSTKIGNYLIERGPNSLLADAELTEMVKGFGLGEQILHPEAVSKNRFIFKNGKYQKLPAGPAFLFSSFFSLNTKLAVFKEYSKKSVGPENESVAAFFERRFCKEIVEYAVNPFVAGIYAGDPAQLLISKTFPQLYELEKQYGSVIKGFLKTRKSTGRKVSYSFEQGMQALPDAMSKTLNINFGQAVKQITKSGTGQFDIKTVDQTYKADQVVLSLPSYAAANLLVDINVQASSAFSNLPYPKMKVLHTAFKKKDMGFLPNGFGGLHPQKEGLFTAGSIWSSSLFPNRCPADEFLFTSFVGGSQFEAQASQADDKVKEKVITELKDLFKIKNDPVFQELTYWEQAIPQYTEATIEAHILLDQLKGKGIYHCTNWKDGVSVADCLKKGKQLAETLAQKIS